MGAEVPGQANVAFLLDQPPDGDTAGSPFPTLAYIDATADTGPLNSSGEVAIHILWTAPRTIPRLRLGDASDPAEHICAPGDFLLVPPGVPFALGAGIVAVMVGTQVVSPVSGSALPTHSDRYPRPTHGLPVFSGYNRQTFGVATPTLALGRWKLTQIQTVSAPATGPLWLSNLVEPVAVTWSGGAILPGRTEGLFLAPGSTVTLVPNNLGYVLAAWVPNLATDVIAPLRSAGYTNADIASLGVPENDLRPT